MDVFNILALLITLAAGFAWLNHRFLRLPTTIGVMVIALVFSLAMIGAVRTGLGDPEWFAWFREVEFGPTLLEGMLGFLLFAGALHVDLDDLASQKWVVGFLATFGVLISTAAVGLASFGLFHALGLAVPLPFCLLFGALVSPTDPIAVLSILKQAGVPESLETKITGESLFNDGVGLVVFLVLLATVTGDPGHGLGDAAELFAREVVGGLVLGIVLGGATFRLLATVDEYQVEVLLTLGLATGGYALAHALHVSGPLAMVAAGLLIGNPGRRLAMSERTRTSLDTFWELVDEVLNAVLFVMIGLEVLVLPFTPERLGAGLLVIPLVLSARFAAVGLGVGLLRRFRRFSPHAVKIMTWGGLRGGISIALALSLPAGAERDVLVPVTYTVVAFSIGVQGLTVGPLVRRLGSVRAATAPRGIA
jgi:CPA1 family monovalent cation:H+ antiporter